MDILDIIKNRRSIRKFKNQHIPDDVFTNILTAAEYAPSAVNAQDYEFLVIDDKELFKKIVAIHPHADSVLTSDKTVIVLGNLKKEHAKGFWVQDCSAAVQNMILAAHAYGIGSVWCGIYPAEERVKGFMDLFSLPEHIVPFALVPLGLPDEQHPAKPRIYQDMVSYNKYGCRR